ncbi:MAG: biopolymer transporter ExbD [Agarilytica sp.]
MKQSIRAKRMERHHRRTNNQSKLNLVSLMDIFTILVFFLLVNSSEVEVLQSNKDIKLPASVAEKKPETNLVVMVSSEEILVGGRKVTSVKQAMKSEGNEITLLSKELKYLASRKPYRDVKEQEKGRDVTIMGDEKIPYALLKKIMTTCAKSDYRNISLAVSQVPDDAMPVPGVEG